MNPPWKKRTSRILTFIGILNYLSLVPFMVFAITDQFELAILSALTFSVVSTALAKGFKVLKTIDITFTTYYAVCAVLLLFPAWINVIRQYYSAMLWLVLTLMAGISLILKNPFTMQHAKQGVTKTVWNTSQFYDVNKLLTWIFLVVFTVNTVINIIWYDNILRLPISFALLFLAIGMTILIPPYYVRRSITGVRTDVQIRTADFSGLTMQQIFEGMVRNFDSTKAYDWDTIIQFIITGRRSGKFFITVRNQTCRLREGIAKNPKLTVTVDSEDWAAIAEGRLDGAQAYMDGKLQVDGDLNELLTFQKVFT